jgi:hypothetical protein
MNIRQQASQALMDASMVSGPELTIRQAEFLANEVIDAILRPSSEERLFTLMEQSRNWRDLLEHQQDVFHLNKREVQKLQERSTQVAGLIQSLLKEEFPEET